MRISTNLLIILSAFTTWIMASQFNSFQPEPELSRELVFAGTVYGFLDQQQIDYEPLGGVHVEVTVNGGNTFYADTWTNVTGSFSFDSDDYTNWPFFHEAQAVITADGYYQQELTLDFSSWPIIMEFYLNPLALMNNFLSGYVSSISEPDGNLVPIQGAVVEIFNNPDDGLLADFITDDTGYYEFGNIAYNANLIAVSAEGFVSQEAILPGFSETPIVLDFILIPVSDPSEFGSVSGSVTVTLTQGGTVYPLGDAMISATQSGADTLSFEVETNDEGNYLLELPVSNDLWQISCSTLFGDQYEEVLIEPSSNLQLDFHFNAWESQPLPAPQNLIGELSEDESQVLLEWEPPLEWPQFCVPHYTVLSNDMNDPQNEWIEIGDTYLLMWQDFQEPDSLGIDICYRVEAICLDIISEPGNIVCVQSWEVPYPPPPNGLTAIWDPDSGPNGTAILDWYYPIIPQPELTPLFSVYANLGELTENQFLYIGETTEFHFEYPFDEFTEPDSENCFRVQALLGEEISDFSNTACIYFNEEQPGSFQIWGYVYRADDQEMISDAMIQAGNVMNGVTYETVSDDTGYYELLVEPGEYIITGMIDYNILQQHHFILQNESELRLDFWYGEFPEAYHL
ncbi:MAG: hypothetical protein ACE5D7_03645, partial [Fidelibacterota bacterium]